MQLTKVAERMIIEDPEEVAVRTREIIEYDLPPGFEEQAMIDMFFGKMIMIGQQNESNSFRV